MECSLVALVACFSWSGFYIDSGLSYVDVTYSEVELHGSEVEYVARSHNPFGKLGIGFQLNLSPNFLAEVELAHASSLKTQDDRGVNSISLNVRWYPFRH
jgi:hypothetical protein